MGRPSPNVADPGHRRPRAGPRTPACTSLALAAAAALLQAGADSLLQSPSPPPRQFAPNGKPAFCQHFSKRRPTFFLPFNRVGIRSVSVLTTLPPPPARGRACVGLGRGKFAAAAAHLVDEEHARHDLRLALLAPLRHLGVDLRRPPPPGPTNIPAGAHPADQIPERRLRARVETTRAPCGKAAAERRKVERAKGASCLRFGAARGGLQPAHRVHPLQRPPAQCPPPPPTPAARPADTNPR